MFNFKGYNLPVSVTDAIQKAFNEKQGDFIAIKTNLTVRMTEIISEKTSSLSKKLWEENEIVFLQDGTKDEDVNSFAKFFLISLLRDSLDSLMDNVEEDLT